MNTINNMLKPLAAKGKKGPARMVTEQDIEASLLPLFDYLDGNVSIASVEHLVPSSDLSFV